jgi:hypothetical protein
LTPDNWPKIIYLREPNNCSRYVSDHAPFDSDREALRRRDLYLLKVGFRYEVDLEVSTWVGLFVTYTDLDKRVSPAVPGGQRLGFGPAGMGAPAQLFFKTVEGISVTKGGLEHH